MHATTAHPSLPAYLSEKLRPSTSLVLQYLFRGDPPDTPSHMLHRLLYCPPGFADSDISDISRALLWDDVLAIADTLDVSKDYADALDRHVKYIDDNMPTWDVGANEEYVAAWSHERVKLVVEAAAMRAGLLTRWELTVEHPELKRRVMSGYFY